VECTLCLCFTKMFDTHPLVSCIMPTANRRQFVPQAIRYFQVQDYPNKELIILDDGSDSVADLVPSDPRIRYLRQERKSTVGAKRNLACREARGEIIVHWDDDDWISEKRLSYQVKSLIEEQADICGLNKVLFFNPASNRCWEYIYSNGSRPWVYGATLCYTRPSGEQVPFLISTWGRTPASSGVAVQQRY
jgi:glycosyltransferase involved in cell wall biosynthesis